MFSIQHQWFSKIILIYSGSKLQYDTVFQRAFVSETFAKSRFQVCLLTCLTLFFFSKDTIISELVVECFAFHQGVVHWYEKCV
mmetsp:Transcript_27778/g.41630  ORF Transcript_27778/g.41630 Transcript_27778/m.41630 type:complete len:83 (-) Transcript_27778:220-468(-)